LKAQTIGTRTCPCEGGDITVLWNQAVHTDRKVRANRPDIKIKKTRRENMHTDRIGNTADRSFVPKEVGKKLKYKS